MTNPNFRGRSEGEHADFLSDPAYWESVKQGLLEIKPLSKYHDENDSLEDLEKEKYFAKAVYEAAKTAIESGGKHLHILFDIDNTIGSYDFNTHTKFSIRPSVFKTLEEIQKLAEQFQMKFDIGFLSNREVEHTKKQLEEGGQLVRLKPWVNNNLVFSSRGVAK
ncbi:MAG TPA: hypothetical protein VE973_00190, partial [Candidatus Limnocylindria bacterium]|nr:hypothetical protein [Candidatus Limnocylindria bacterium]